jgi:sec-independent protein translocase protein TatB
VSWGLTFEKLLLIGLIAVILIGPDRLPGYAAQFGRLIRSLRDMANGAKTRMREEMGPDYDDVDWKKLDPRQYDPRRIIREALVDEAVAVVVVAVHAARLTLLTDRRALRLSEAVRVVAVDEAVTVVVHAVVADLGRGAGDADGEGARAVVGVDDHEVDAAVAEVAEQGVEHRLRFLCGGGAVQIGLAFGFESEHAGEVGAPGGSQ